jgi:membrane-associated protease RseP (regulator of RpoE activity)
VTDMRREQEPRRLPERAAPSQGHRDEPPSYETGGLRLALLIGAVVLVGIRFGWPLVVMILGVVVTIFFHELGHYLTARWAGMKCTEFFIGFGPKIWSLRRGECEYGFKVIPAGAYVRIIGMNNLDEVDPADEPRTYREQSFPKRLLVVSAGSLSHLVQAFVIGVLLFGVVGMPGGSLTDPEVDSFEIGSVTEDSAAEAIGLQEGDVIVAIDGRPASAFDDLSDALVAYDVDDDVTLTLERGDATETVTATLGARPANQPGGEVGGPFLGVGSVNVMSADPVGIGAAIVETPGQMWDVTTASVAALGHVFSPTGLSEFADNFSDSGSGGSAGTSGGSEGQRAESGGRSGGLMSIVGFVHVGTADVENRAAFMLALFFNLNLLLGLINMLPLPPLDGGHAAMAIYERARSRDGRRYHADFAKLLPLTYAVFLVLVMIGVTTIYLDIVKPIPL